MAMPEESRREKNLMLSLGSDANEQANESKPATDPAASARAEHAIAQASAPLTRASAVRWPRRKILLWGGAALGVAAISYFVVPWIVVMLSTVSTDDAFVNGHVTLVAARVPGQVMEVLVDDNYRVKQGDILVRLDKEPYQVQVDIKKAALDATQTDLAAAQAQIRGLAAQTRANRFKLEHAIENVQTQIANLRAAVATLNSRKATLELATENY